MDPRYWGIVAILVIGVAVIAYGALSDRRATQRQRDALTAPPKRDIPRLSPTSEPPSYLTELQARTKPAGANTDLDAPTRRRLSEAQAAAFSIPSGYPRLSFITDRSTGWFVAEAPIVLICDAEITAIREVLPLMERAKKTGRPLILVAADISEDVVDTFSANSVQGMLRCVPIQLGDPELRAGLASAVGAHQLTVTDLRAGYVPADALGSAETWLCDEDTSWVIQS
ncbi:MAG: hypothetical protein WAS07_15895 [Micropruina sp.]|nr:hypothetical protein [Micropruina sp.]